MSKCDTLFSELILEPKDWVFDKRVVDVFPDMIQRSIPGYNNLISMIGVLAKKCVKSNSQVYDLGCSVGTTTLEIYKNITVKGCKIIAIDNSSAMVECLRHGVKSCISSDILVEVFEEDIRRISIKNASLVILNFTLQFVDPKERQQLINTIWQGLNAEGVLVLSEKFRYLDSNIEALLVNMHDSFKRQNGYSDIEIEQKRRMLAKVMLIDTPEMHIERLQTAGFKHYTLWFQYFNFGSVVAVK
ncbi:carboxy-S-adenosyl-L-methionine synthase CmoA [Candidatus Erwinia haradaeae]|nr:carboxy-S-adenosyl-L-methionine synthase CmoA [Candidatus Erwinia haradaeae]